MIVWVSEDIWVLIEQHSSVSFKHKTFEVSSSLVSMSLCSFRFNVKSEIHLLYIKKSSFLTHSIFSSQWF